ncbi:MAG TPA: sugar transferase [Acidimicrobiales bacterium]|nr:sugar transferase [Acidimicrobiales bacterium]
MAIQLRSEAQRGPGAIGAPLRARPAPAARVRRRPRFGAVVALGDVFALSLAVGLASGMTQRVGWWGWAFMAVVVCVLAATGHYRLGIAPSVSADAGPLIGCVAASVLALGLVVERGARADLVHTGLYAAGFLLGMRAFSYWFLGQMRARGVLVENTLIIGAGKVGVELAGILRDHPGYGLVPVGFLDSFDDAGLPLPILGGAQNLDRVLSEYGVRRVVIAFGAVREPDMVPIVRACDRASVDIHVLPRFFELGFSAKGRDVDEVWGMPLLRLRRAALRSNAWRVKRAFDVVVAGLALVALSPVYLAVALAVRLSSPGPVYHRQRRTGQRGEVIEVLKFRSMLVNEDADTKWSVDGDERVTRVGRFIRRFSLDELPQLINVLRGEMSLVGPRPERPFFVNRFAAEIPRYGDRHRVPVGLTGLAQVHGLRGDTPVEERARFDNSYIENWSLWWDISILARTVSAVLRHARARRPRPG